MANFSVPPDRRSIQISETFYDHVNTAAQIWRMNRDKDARIGETLAWPVLQEQLAFGACAQIAADATPMSGTNLEPEMINVCFPLSAYRETFVMAIRSILEPGDDPPSTSMDAATDESVNPENASNAAIGSTPGLPILDDHISAASTGALSAYFSC